MNRIFGIILILFGVVVLSACGGKTDSSDRARQPVTTDSNEDSGGVAMQGMVIEVGGKKFPVTLHDNETVRALTQQLPMTLNMEELHGNEKFYYLEEGLPANPEDVGSIQTGEIMLFGSDCLVLFFEDFSTSYSYTRIGRVDDAQGFANALAGGTVEVTFETGSL